MHGAISEVRHFFGMPQRETAIHGIAGVAGIGAGGGVAFLERFHESGIGDGPGPTTVAHALKLAVPTLGGKPDFNLDIGILAGAQSGGDAAESGQSLR